MGSSLKKEVDSFWITNISNKDVGLHDLGVTIRAFSTINLLDSKHYLFTRPQLEESANSGSIFKRRDKVVIRKVPPGKKYQKPIIHLTEDAIISSKQRSTVKIEEVKYEELEVSDVQFAEENADLAEEERSAKFQK